MKSLFDEFGGHYSVMVDGVEIAKFAPSHFWSEYATTIADRPGFSYAWAGACNEDGAA